MKNNKNQLRIIGGKWRGRKISFPDLDDLRPTGDRIRETLFNWLAPVIKGAICLDLFTGSGALGLEALSRGAAQVTMIDNAMTVKRSIDLALSNFNADNGRMIKAHAKIWLSNAVMSNDSFDIVFLDPPFGADYLQDCCSALQDNNWLKELAMIYIESELQLEQLNVPGNWKCHRNKSAGSVNYYLFTNS